MKSNEIIMFGKYKGYSIENIIEFDPSYILWLDNKNIINFDDDIILICESLIEYSDKSFNFEYEMQN